MILEADATGLEVVGAGFLSQCPVLCNELVTGVDVHGANESVLGIDRLTAKKFFFRLIYGGTEFSYANDTDFNHISSKPNYWKNVIDNFYVKYYGISQWHYRLVFDVQRSGEYTSPTGRKYKFQPTNGEWPRTTILNYPVQGLGADIMSLIRISSWRRIRRELPRALFVNTVHDSIVLDLPEEDVKPAKQIIDQVFIDFPGNFKRIFGSEFNLPLRCKVKVGLNWKDLQEI